MWSTVIETAAAGRAEGKATRSCFALPPWKKKKKSPFLNLRINDGDTSASHAAARRRWRAAHTRGHGRGQEICSDILSFVHRNMLRRCCRVPKQINQITSSQQIPASPLPFLQTLVFVCLFFSFLGFFVFFLNPPSLKFRNIGSIFVFYGSQRSRGMQRRRRGRGDTSPSGFRGRSNRPHPIRRRRKDDPNNAWSAASGQRGRHTGAARAHKRTQAHTSAPWLLCLPPPERREPTHVSQRINS